MSWLLKYAGLKAYLVFAGVLVVLGALWFTQVAALRAEVSDAKAATALAEKEPFRPRRGGGHGHSGCRYQSPRGRANQTERPRG